MESAAALPPQAGQRHAEIGKAWAFAREELHATRHTRDFPSPTPDASHVVQRTMDQKIAQHLAEAPIQIEKRCGKHTENARKTPHPPEKEVKEKRPALKVKVKGRTKAKAKEREKMPVPRQPTMENSSEPQQSPRQFGFPDQR